MTIFQWQGKDLMTWCRMWQNQVAESGSGGLSICAYMLSGRLSGKEAKTTNAGGSSLGLARTKHVRCIYGIFGREIT